MGKRAGNIVTIDEVMDEIDEAAGRKGAGADALRFFFLSRSANSNVEFDIELAKKKQPRQPGLLRPVRPRAPLLDPAQRPGELGLSLAGARRAVEQARRTPTSSRSRRSSATSRTSWPRPRACASRTASSSTCRSSRATSRATSRASRARTTPSCRRRACARERGWEAAWDLGKTRARLAWIEAIRGHLRRRRSRSSA